MLDDGWDCGNGKGIRCSPDLPSKDAASAGSQQKPHLADDIEVAAAAATEPTFHGQPAQWTHRAGGRLSNLPVDKEHLMKILLKIIVVVVV